MHKVPTRYLGTVIVLCLLVSHYQTLSNISADFLDTVTVMGGILIYPEGSLRSKDFENTSQWLQPYPWRCSIGFQKDP